MKALFLLLFIPSIALADTWSMPNKNGGEIVITNRNCVIDGKNYGPLKMAYSYWNGGYLEGCWLIQDDLVKVLWRTTGAEGVLQRVYPPEEFTPKTQSPKTPSPKTPRS
jgi:hypothetical protein